MVGVLVLAGLVAAIGSIASGRFDPKTVGEEQTALPLGALTVSSTERTVRWLDPVPSLQVPFSIKLAAKLDHGTPDTGYGLVLATPGGETEVVVAPTGYTAVLERSVRGDSVGTSGPVPWQPWPHVRRGDKMNEIWIDLDENEVRVRINGEFLWAGELSGPVASVGVVAESHEGTAVVDFHQVEFYSPGYRS